MLLPLLSLSMMVLLATGRLFQQANKSLLTGLASCLAQITSPLKAERKRRKYPGPACTMSIRGLAGI